MTTKIQWADEVWNPVTDGHFNGRMAEGDAMSRPLDGVIPDEFVDWAEAHGACDDGVAFARAAPRRWSDLKPEWRGWCAEALVRRGAALDDPLIVSLIYASDKPAYWRGWCVEVAGLRGYSAVETVRRGAALDDPLVLSLIDASNDPTLWRGRCAVEAVRRGAALDDPLVQSTVVLSDDPAYWRGRCAEAAARRTNNAEDERLRG